MIMKKKLDSKKETTKIDELFALSIRKLKNSDCSIEKMKEFLKKKNASEEEINEVINKLLKYSIINEDEMVKSIISFCDYKHYGYNKLIYILESRKISKSRIEKISKNEEREIRHAKELTKTLIKRYKNKNTVNLRRSLFCALIRAGYDENTASLCVSNISISYKDEINMLKLDYQKAFLKVSKKYKGKEAKEKIINRLVSKGYKIDDIKKVISKEI